MESPTGKQELLNLIRAEHAALEASIAGLTYEQLSAPGATGGWSAKDVLAHVTWWELRTLEKVNGQAAPFNQPGEDQETAVNRVNDTVYREHRDQSAAEIRAAFDASFLRVTESLNGFSEEHLLANLEGIAQDTYGHYPEHTAALQAWRAKEHTKPGGA
jgi:hypothetical protein